MTGQEGWAAIPNRIARDPSIHYGAKALFLALASYADERGRAWPSQTTLAADTGMSEGTVKRHLTALRDAGLLAWEVRATQHGRQRFYTVWRPGADLTGVGSAGGGVGSEMSRPVGASQGGEQEPRDQEPLDPDTSAGADGALISVEAAGGKPAPVQDMPTGRDLFAAWVDGYTKAHGAKPDPAVNGQLSGRVREVVRTRDGLESWRHAWRAFNAAGMDGSLYIAKYLLTPAVGTPAPLAAPRTSPWGDDADVIPPYRPGLYR